MCKQLCSLGSTCTVTLISWLCSLSCDFAVQIGVCSNPEVVDSTGYALEAAKNIIMFYEEEFGVAYPLPKQGELAIHQIWCHQPIQVSVDTICASLPPPLPLLDGMCLLPPWNLYTTA